jgi:hydrogenase nickel incorporation protein HypA/HybF
MHELSIADAILRIADTHAGGRRIESVEVRIGRLRQVVPDALRFAFELLAPGVALEIEEVPAAGVCRTCGAQSELPGFPLACAACGSLDVELVRGEELLVDALTMEGVPSGRC